MLVTRRLFGKANPPGTAQQARRTVSLTDLTRTHLRPSPAGTFPKIPCRLRFISNQPGVATCRTAGPTHNSAGAPGRTTPFHVYSGFDGKQSTNRSHRRTASVMGNNRPIFPCTALQDVQRHTYLQQLSVKAISKPLRCSVSAAAGPEAWCKHLCPGPVCRLHKRGSNNRCRSLPQTGSSTRCHRPR